MLEQYSEETLKLIEIACNEAKSRANDYIGTEHILLAILKDANDLPAKILEKMGITINEVLMELERRSSSRQDVLKFEKIPLTPSAREVIELAREEAHSLGSDVKKEHLLLGLIREEEGLAGEILRALGANLEDGRLLTKYSKPMG